MLVRDCFHAVFSKRSKAHSSLFTNSSWWRKRDSRMKESTWNVALFTILDFPGGFNWNLTDSYRVAIFANFKTREVGTYITEVVWDKNCRVYENFIDFLTTRPATRHVARQIISGREASNFFFNLSRLKAISSWGNLFLNYGTTYVVNPK